MAAVWVCQEGWGGTYPRAAMEAVLHDGDEFLVAQMTVPILIKDNEHGAHNVRLQSVACANFHRSLEIL